MHKTQKREANKKQPCVTQKLSLQNFLYANDVPLLLAVIPGGRVQENKNLAGFLFCLAAIFFFFCKNCRNFRRADEDAFSRKNTEEYGRLAALLWEVSNSADDLILTHSVPYGILRLRDYSAGHQESRKCIFSAILHAIDKQDISS